LKKEASSRIVSTNNFDFMNQPIPPSELILNPDGSIYHLKLRPEHIAPTILLVGDPDRVAKVSKYFDRIDFKIQRREFVTHTGWLGGQRISALSTGIGTDNIDIVLNELDALVNIDLETRMIKEKKTSLKLIRVGTSGALSASVPIDSLVVSAYGIGLDALLGYYYFEPNDKEDALTKAYHSFSASHGLPVRSPAAMADPALVNQLQEGMVKGITLSCPGFYGPQGRVIRLRSKIAPAFFADAGKFSFDGLGLTNFEMETSALLGMARLLGHHAVSTNAIIANRITNEFSPDPAKTIDHLIQTVLGKL